MRGISIALVCAGHLAGARGFLGIGVLRHAGDLANLGVRVFFLISGFLITSLLLTEIDTKGGISLTKFYYRRTLRILPAFYLFLASMAIAGAVGAITLKPGDLAHAATFTINYHHDRAWWLGHVWSLSVEEQFYLLWPAAIFWLGSRRALYGAAAVVVVAPAIRLAALSFSPHAGDFIGESFPTVADTIATGCLFAALAPRLRGAPLAQRLLASRWFVLVPALGFALNLKSGGRLSVAVLETVINLCAGLCVARVTMVTSGATARLLDSAPLVAIGRRSYSLYLWQQPFLNRYASAVATTFPLNVVFAAACAAMSYRFVELPCLAIRDRHRTRLSGLRISASGQRSPATA